MRNINWFSDDEGQFIDWRFTNTFQRIGAQIINNTTTIRSNNIFRQHILITWYYHHYYLIYLLNVIIKNKINSNQFNQPCELLTTKQQQPTVQSDRVTWLINEMFKTMKLEKHMLTTYSAMLMMTRTTLTTMISTMVVVMTSSLMWS